MRKLKIILFLFFFPIFVFCQKTNNAPIYSSIQILNIHQTSLQELSPFEEEQRDDILRLNRKISEQLLTLLQFEEVANFRKDSLPFFGAESADKNLAVFSWDGNTGGTFREFNTVLAWKNLEGAPQAFLMKDDPTPFSQIFELQDTMGDTIYLLLGNGYSCSNCVFEKALLLKIKETELEEVFSFQIDYPFSSDMLGLVFHPESQILTYEYLQEDCEEEEKKDCWVKGEFSFDGLSFQ